MPRDLPYLLDILQAARLARQYVADKDRQAFLRDTQCQDAVIRRLEIIGEAARRISPEMKSRLSQLDWTGMIGMRNFMIHEYEDVDLIIVWQTIQDDLPELIEAILPLVPSE
jgi:uncharacterized protein with HEPN domain